MNIDDLKVGLVVYVGGNKYKVCQWGDYIVQVRSLDAQNYSTFHINLLTLQNKSV